MAFQIGVDVGGTFTDLVVSNDDELHLGKTPTTPGDEAQGILTGLGDVADHYERPLETFLGESEVIVLGTTIVTNALLEYKGAKVGVITTAGFRDMLDLRRNHRESLFDIRLQPPHPIAPRQMRLGVEERIDQNGGIRIPLDEDGAREAARRLRELGAESIAVCFLFSFVNPAHEERMGEILAEELPRHPGHPLLRGAAADPRVRAPQHHHRQRLLAPARRARAHLAERTS